MNYNDVINSAETVLVEFYASWCPHCQRMMPIVAQIKKQLAGIAKVYQYDIDQNKELADANNVESIPTFIVYSKGKEMWHQTGEMSEKALLQEVEKYAKVTA